MSVAVAFVLFLLALFVVTNGQLTLSQTRFTLVENQAFQVTCDHTEGAIVSLIGLESLYTSSPLDNNATVFTFSRVLKSDNNKQFVCVQANVVTTSSPASVTVYYLTARPEFPSNWTAVSVPGDFFLNISIVANPFVIPENITATQTPPSVTLPAFTIIPGVNDTGTAYVKLDRFQLPQYAGSYAITLKHPAVGSYVINFSLTVLYAPRYTYSSNISNTTVDIDAKPGLPLSLSCAATGVPEPTIFGINSSFNAATNSYMFAAVSSKDVGYYVCVANNSVGFNGIAYKLSVEGGTSPNNAGALSSTLLILIVSIVALL